MTALKSSASPANPKGYALKLLSYRARSRKEMLQKLENRGYGPEEIQQTLAALEHARLIDDEALAEDLTRYGIEQKHLGKNGIRVFLLKRGIERDQIEAVLAEHTREMEIRAAAELVKKKMKTLRTCSDEVVKRRLWGMLRRRGFSGEVIYSVLNAAK